jgi:F420-non-reducing hydrogenase small subunit
MAAHRSLAVYWGAGCGGCEVSLLNLDETLLDVLENTEIVFCPALVDTKYADVEAMPDGGIDVTLFNGAIRTGENEEMARLLRRTSRVMVAYGSCAGSGCVPGLANLSPLAEQLRTVYHRPSTDNPHDVLPRDTSAVREGTLTLTPLSERVRPVGEVVDVDYTIPGCPPEPAAMASALLALLDGTDLPPRGSVLGAGSSTVCAECSRTRGGKVVTRFRRTWEVDPDPTVCLLDQGLVCLGIATRSGCGALCPGVNTQCIGCYGAPEGVRDQGAAMAGALGSMIDISPAAGRGDEGVAAYVDEVLDAIPDWVGTFYAFGLPSSSLDAAALHHAGPARCEPVLPAPREPDPAPREPEKTSRRRAQPSS